MERPPRTQAVLLAVRPQSLCLGDPKEDAAFAVMARVRDVVYLGTSSRIVLTVGDGPEFTAEVSQHGVRQPEQGDTVEVWARKDDAIVFDDTGRDRRDSP